MPPITKLKSLMRRISHQWAGGKVHGLDIGVTVVAVMLKSVRARPRNILARPRNIFARPKTFLARPSPIQVNPSYISSFERRLMVNETF